jgi:phosphonoacetate hydrolase
MVDGLGWDYLDSGATPFLSDLFEQGGQVVAGLWPTVTNVNNAAIACAAPPSVTGITGNSYLDTESGTTSYMDKAHMLNTPTLLETWSEQGRRCCLISAKGKTGRLLGRGVAYVVNSQEAPAELVEAVGTPPDIYSGEVNLWLVNCLAWLIEHRPDLDTYYVHTTDYPMHMWAPADPRSQNHLRNLDLAIRHAVESVGEVEVLLTADHGMNDKTRAIDLGRILQAQGVTEALALSIEKDGYVAHHRDLGGGAWVWVDEGQAAKAAEIMAGLDGVDEVLYRAEAAARFSLDATRIGDLAVLGDRRTVFGDLATERELLAPGYRSHGSLYEREVPLLRWGVSDLTPVPGDPMNWHLLAPFHSGFHPAANG